MHNPAVTPTSSGTYVVAAACLAVAAYANHAVPTTIEINSHATGKYSSTLHQDDSQSALAEKFDALSRQWLDETAFLSSSSELIAHPAYLQIIGLGPPAIPFLLQALDARPGLWFFALTAIAGNSPVAPEDAGNYDKMRAAWIDWGRQHGHV